VAATRLIAMHVQKARSIQQCIKDRTDYAENCEKTEGGSLISAYECEPKTAAREFAVSQNYYSVNTGRPQHANDIIAYQIRQAFKPGEITPEEANRIGYETAMRWTKGKHAFIVATHVDKKHVHNHIIYNASNLSCDRKFRNFFFSGIALQKVSDLVCIENGLSVIEPKKPSEREKRTVYKSEKSYREKIRESIDACMEKKPKDMEELLRFLEEMDYEIKRGKNISLKSKEQNKFLRFRSLGDGYRQEDLELVFAGTTTFESNPKQTSGRFYKKKDEPKLDMLVDIQEIIAKEKGPGYERWARIHNVKQIAQTLLFLEEHDLRDYKKLEAKANEVSERFAEISKKQKELEARLVEIAGLKKHIINYSKTKEIYAEYRKNGYSKKFFEEHREAITLHKAAKDAFSKVDGPIPKIKDLNAEYERILKEKKEAYAEYRQAKQELKDYQTAKYNVDQFLKKNEAELDAQRKKNRNKSL